MDDWEASASEASWNSSPSLSPSLTLRAGPPEEGDLRGGEGGGFRTPACHIAHLLNTSPNMHDTEISTASKPACHLLPLLRLGHKLRVCIPGPIQGADPEWDKHNSPTAELHAEGPASACNSYPN